MKTSSDVSPIGLPFPLSNLESTAETRSDRTLVLDWCISRASNIFKIERLPQSLKSSLFRIRTEDNGGGAGGGKGGENSADALAKCINRVDPCHPNERFVPL